MFNIATKKESLQQIFLSAIPLELHDHHVDSTRECVFKSSFKRAGTLDSRHSQRQA